MNGRRAAAFAAVFAALSIGCAAGARHRLLDLFFDGVPRGSERTAPTGEASPESAAAPAVEARDHGPYAAKLCDGCHETGRANALLGPRDQLCSRCHVIPLDKRFVHGPLVAGGCLLCHDPHRSQYPYLLVSDSGTFCLRCHDRASLGRVEGHVSADSSCTRCHEAHMADRRFLLK